MVLLISDPMRPVAGLEESRRQLPQTSAPGIRLDPPRALGAAVTDGPTDDRPRRRINLRADRALPTVDRTLTDIEVELIARCVLYKALQNSEFQEAVRGAYPRFDSDEPPSEFSAVLGHNDVS